MLKFEYNIFKHLTDKPYFLSIRLQIPFLWTRSTPCQKYGSKRNRSPQTFSTLNFFPAWRNGWMFLHHSTKGTRVRGSRLQASKDDVHVAGLEEWIHWSLTWTRPHWSTIPLFKDVIRQRTDNKELADALSCLLQIYHRLGWRAMNHLPPLTRKTIFLGNIPKPLTSWRGHHIRQWFIQLPIEGSLWWMA